MDGFYLKCLSELFYFSSLHRSDSALTSSFNDRSVGRSIASPNGSSVGQDEISDAYLPFVFISNKIRCEIKVSSGVSGASLHASTSRSSRRSCYGPGYSPADL